MLRAPARPIWPIFALAVCALLLATMQRGFADQPRASGTAPPALFPDDGLQGVSTGALEIIRRFDFDERPLGNYEETPLNWVHLDGEGLPRYSTAKLDDGFGRLAPPSFRFDLEGGSIAYQYVGDDLPLTHGAEHLVVAYARAVGLHHARAFLQISLLDEVGNRLRGGDRVSNLIASTLPPESPDAALETGSAAAAEPWQRIEVVVPTNFPDAASVRITLWVLQRYVWREPAEVDPIVRQDVHAQVWFDDLTLYRLPHVDLRLSTASPIVRAGTPASLVIEIHNPTRAALQFELSISDACGDTLHTTRGTVPENVSHPVKVTLPSLEPGTYTARLRLSNESESFGNSSLRFAVVRELPAVASSATDFGVDLGELPAGDSDQLVDLLENLGCGAVKLGLPLPEDSNPDAAADSTRELVRRLLVAGIDPAGVILPPRAAGRKPRGTARAALLALNRRALLAPLLFPLGNAISYWQLGAERTELANGSAWDAATLAEVRRDIQRFVAVPELVLPVSIFDADNSGAMLPVSPAQNSGTSFSVYVPPQAPTRELPAQLANVADSKATWLMLETDRSLPVETRIAEIARRLILAKAAGHGRIFLPAPLACDCDTGCWYPTDEYVALRTLFRFLAGKQATAVLPGGHDAQAILFTGDDDSACVVAWSWRNPPGPPLALCGAEHAEIWDVWGRRKPCNSDESNEQILVPLGATPAIVAPVEAGLVALQASLAVDPNFIDADNPETHPILKLCNPFANEMVGTIRLSLPDYWRAGQVEIPFQLSSGQTLEHPLDLVVPPRETSGEKLLGIELDISAPAAMTVAAPVPLRLGLTNVDFDACAWWRGSDLLVEQVVRNHGGTPLDFACSCQAPGRRQLDGALLNIAPGASTTQVFTIPNARDLAGTSLLVGLKEPGGRCLESVIPVPP